MNRTTLKSYIKSVIEEIAPGWDSPPLPFHTEVEVDEDGDVAEDECDEEGEESIVPNPTLRQEGDRRRRALRESLGTAMKFGSIESILRKEKKYVDLPELALKQKSSKNLNALEGILYMNSSLWESVDSLSFWRETGENYLSLWEYRVPQSQDKSEEDADAGTVTTFWDAEKGGTLYSVKSTAEPTTPGNFKKALQKSNIKLSSTISIIRKSPRGTRLGNIGCIWHPLGDQRVFQWGNITAPISTEQVTKNIANLLTDPTLKKAFLDLMRDKIGSAEEEVRILAEVESAMKGAGIITSGSRITGSKIPSIFGPWSGELIGQITTLEPRRLMASLNPQATALRPDSPEATAKKSVLLARITTLAATLNQKNLRALHAYARNLGYGIEPNGHVDGAEP